MNCTAIDITRSNERTVLNSKLNTLLTEYYHYYISLVAGLTCLGIGLLNLIVCVLRLTQMLRHRDETMLDPSLFSSRQMYWIPCT